MFWFYLLSGLFLGWSLGANDAANVFGTAVGARMVRFKTAAVISSAFVLLGAVLSGAGTTETLVALGAVSAPAASFTLALVAGLTVFWMTKATLPVSTTQAIVGAILGWNMFTHSRTDPAVLTKIVATWVLSPVLAGAFAVVLYLLFKRVLNRAHIHLLRLDAYTRAGLIIVGAFGAYSLGANNIANVVGVFVRASPFTDIGIAGSLHISGAQQLFLLGSLAISFGICSYSFRMMTAVGNEIVKLTPILAMIAVLAHSLVLLVFASKGLKTLLTSVGLPSLPLVPVSSSQAIVGAICGLGLLKSSRTVNYRYLGKIVVGWVLTPVVAALLSFVALFFVQNVFQQPVVR
ncbi:MAG: inorganic phosphate transporter [bacterium]|jgi:PiT family inorganic phosphate transporter|nr:inorganic phosphate transporter [candidate division KSB1 bacterium]MDH7560627.1 inorganic phosphate transporter [bacterium]